MVWDLGRAMHKKEEFESARLATFEFRQRARAMRLLAPLLGEDPDRLAVLIAEQPDEKILAMLAEATGCPLAEVTALHQQCWIDARVQLVAEIGDPTPYRLG